MSRPAKLQMNSYRRRSIRLPVLATGLAVEIDGTEYGCVDWSPAGLMIEGFTAMLPEGKQIVGAIKAAGAAPIEFQARVAHSDIKSGRLGLALAEPNKELLKRLAGGIG